MPLIIFILALLVFPASSVLGDPAPPVVPVVQQDPKAKALLTAAKAKLRSIPALIADYEETFDPTADFEREQEIFLERPNRFRIDDVKGVANERRSLDALSNGLTVTEIHGKEFVAYEKPVRQENFFLGHNFLVQFFFDPRDIAFDPTHRRWRFAISQFDQNRTAFDKDTKVIYIGTRELEDARYEVVEIRYNTREYDLRQQIYVGADKLIYQVDTVLGAETYSQKFRNFRLVAIPVETWKLDKPQKLPVVATDPVRLGAPAPAFTLPGHNGGEYSLAGLLAGKKGLFVSVLNGEKGKHSVADYYLAEMQTVQKIKNMFEPQGLAVVCIVGGTGITPDVKKEMMLNWMPDVSRFNYPIAIDIDVERGIQGSAYQNFQLNGRNTLLLDSKARVVFAAKDFTTAVSQLALYQAMAQIGFNISAADIESTAR